jgi:hypothetical protein
LPHLSGLLGSGPLHPRPVLRVEKAECHVGVIGQFPARARTGRPGALHRPFRGGLHQFFDRDYQVTAGALPHFLGFSPEKSMTLDQVEIMRAYLCEWMGAPWLKGQEIEALRARIAELDDHAAIEQWLAGVEIAIRRPHIL